VFFRPPAGKNFSIAAHHNGFTTPSRIGRPVMAVPFAGGGVAFFKRARESKIPAREIWPTQQEAGALIRRAVTAWLQQGQGSWR
jgi:hypothetical protein